MRNLICGAALGAASFAVLGAASSSKAAIAYAVTDDNSIVTFDTASPTVLTAGVPLRTAANTAIQDLIGIDVRPATGQVYGVGKFGTIYTINPATGIATPGATLVADPTDTTSPFASLNGSRFGVDFNPIADLLRITSDIDQNLRVNVTTGATTTDTTLNPGNPSVTASAYANNVNGATSTTLYAIDSVTDALYIQTPPNNGTLSFVGSLGVDISSLNGFDILTTGGNGGTNTAYAALQLATNGVSQLYSINLNSGAATLVGTIGGGDMIDGFTLAIPEPTTLGLIGGAAAVLLRRRSR